MFRSISTFFFSRMKLVVETNLMGLRTFIFPFIKSMSRTETRTLSAIPPSCWLIENKVIDV